MALQDVTDCIHVVFLALDIQVVPHLSENFNIGLICSIESIFVFDLQENNRSTVLGPERL